jgi:HK97 family phage major capsid protein
MNIKQLRQMKADNDAAQAKLKAEGRGLLALAADKRTPEQTARLDAIDAALDELATNAATIAADLARAERFADDERRSGTLDATTIQTGADLAAERPWGPRMPANASADMQREVRLAALGEFAIAVRSAMSGTGFDPRLSAAATGMGTSVPSDGGFAVPLEVAAGIERDMFAGGELLSRVDARTISGDAIAYNVVDETSRASTRSGGVLGYWVDQGTAATASQPKLARIEMKLRKVGALGYMTDELVSDAAGLGGELQSMFTEELTFQVEDAIFEGTGQQQPLGYTVAPCVVSVAKESGQSAATINTTNLSKMWARLPARSQRRPRGSSTSTASRSSTSSRFRPALARSSRGSSTTDPTACSRSRAARSCRWNTPHARHRRRHHAGGPAEVPPDSQGWRRAGVLDSRSLHAG